eukprot:8170107-Pyramimonas_sp.AAC.1
MELDGPEQAKWAADSNALSADKLFPVAVPSDALHAIESEQSGNGVMGLSSKSLPFRPSVFAAAACEGLPG